MKGGFELAFCHLDGLMKHMGLNELPQSFMLHWSNPSPPEPDPEP